MADAGVLPKAVVLPNGRIVVEFCILVPKVSGCDVAGATVDVFGVEVPNVNVEFNAEGAAAPTAGVGVEPNINPVAAGAVPVVVGVAPNTAMDEQTINER